MTPMDKCFACDRTIKSNPQTVYCADDQAPYVGPDCFKQVQKAGDVGYQPPKGGPRLYVKKPICVHGAHDYCYVCGVGNFPRDFS